MKRFYSFALLTLCTLLSLRLHAYPILIDLKVVGEIPNFEPATLELDLGQEYLLVLDNDRAYALTFHFGAFGQNVFTRYMQGSPNVSQESLVIPAQQKLTWHFSPQTKGEYAMYAMNTAFNQKGKVGKIVVKSMEESAPVSTEDSAKDKAILIFKLID